MELKEYIRIIKKRLWFILLCVIVSTVTTALYSFLYYKPVYMAHTKLIVNKTIEQEQLGKEQMDFGAIAVNIRLIETYKEIIKTPAITDKVVQRYPDLQLSSDQLSRIINVSALNNTQVMTLSAADYSYERAAKIVNAVSEVFKSEIPKIMKVDNVAVLTLAKITDKPLPVDYKRTQYIIISFAVSLMFAVGLIFLLEFLDDTIKSEDDIQAVLGLTTLSAIPASKKEFQPKKQPSRKKVSEPSYAAKH